MRGAVTLFIVIVARKCKGIALAALCMILGSREAASVWRSIRIRRARTSRRRKIMRLIDADKMAVEESEAYISAQCQIKDELTMSVNAVVHTKIQRLIADTPTVDAVEVVRCKDCKHSLTNNQRYICCKRNGFNSALNFDSDSFCSFGERRNFLATSVSCIGGRSPSRKLGGKK